MDSLSASATSNSHVLQTSLISLILYFDVLRDQLHLFNKDDENVGFVAWNWSLPGLAFRRSKDGSYDYRAENKPAAEVMEDQGNLSEFIKALQVRTG